MIDSATTAELACPQCTSAIRHDRRFAPWCESCDWNVDAGLRPAAPRTRLERYRRSLGQRLGESLYRSVLARPGIRPRLTISQVAAAGLSLVVLLTPVLMLIGGVALIVGRAGIGAAAFGVLLVGLAIVSRPRFDAGPDEMVTRLEAPELYALTDEIVTALGARPVAAIVIDHEWNASTYRYGARQRVALTIGLPLWSVLDGPERVFLLAHEVAHTVNGDTTRSVVIGAALQTLGTWTYVLEPDETDSRDEGFGGLLAIPVDLVLWLLSNIVGLIGELLVLLTFRGSQRAEFYADQLAVSVAGRSAALGSNDRLRHVSAFELAVSGISSRRAPFEELFGEIERLVSGTPESEMERRRRGEVALGSALDATHPPTFQRIGLIEALPDVSPTLELTAERSAMIDAELARYRGPMARAAIEDYRETL